MSCLRDGSKDCSGLVVAIRKFQKNRTLRVAFSLLVDRIRLAIIRGSITNGLGYVAVKYCGSGRR